MYDDTFSRFRFGFGRAHARCVKHIECTGRDVYAQEPGGNGAWSDARLLPRQRAVMFLFILKSCVKRAGQLARLLYCEGRRETGLKAARMA